MGSCSRNAPLHFETLSGNELSSGDRRRHRFESFQFSSCHGRSVPPNAFVHRESQEQRESARQIPSTGQGATLYGEKNRLRLVDRGSPQRRTRYLLLATDAISASVIFDDSLSERSFDPRALLGSAG